MTGHTTSEAFDTAAGRARLRVLVVDDEPAARDYLRTLVRDDPDVAFIDQCGNGRDAVRAIVDTLPDIVLLDVQMPELNGFAVVEQALAAVGPDRMPVLVFVTAYDEYALAAFRVHAFDYLLKPVERDRLAATLGRAKRRLRLDRAALPDEPRVPAAASASAPAATSAESADDVAERLRALLESYLGRPAAADAAPDQQGADDEPLPEGAPRSDRLALKIDGRIVFVDIASIDWVEASDDYARIHVGKQTLQVRDTLARLERRLPASRFLRIHRSTIVNLARVREVQPWFQSDYVVILDDGTRLTTGRSYRARMQEFLRRAL